MSAREGGRNDRPPCERCGEPTYFFAGSGRECEGRVRYKAGRRLKSKCKTGPKPVPEATTWIMSQSRDRVAVELHVGKPTAGSVPIAVLLLDADKAKTFRDQAGFMAHVANGGSCGCDDETEEVPEHGA